MLQKTIIFVVFLCVFSVAALWFRFFYAPEHEIGKEVIVEIPSGASIRTVAGILEANKVINNAAMFHNAIRVLDRTYGVKAGRFTLRENYGIFRAMEALRGVPMAEDVTVMVPEGLTVWETAAIVARSLENVDSAAFVALAYNEEFIRRTGLSGFTSLEGYLFPNTYRFTRTARAEDVILRMVATHRRVFDELSRSQRTANFSNHEIVIMASVVEKEARISDERPLVAGVFYNRLERGIPIGADATVRFAVRNFDRPLRRSQLDSDSPYNTRRFRGLPAGAICSPGRASLAAAKNPDDTEYLFFMARWDGSGRHHFTRTYSEHNRIKNDVRRQNPHLDNF